MTSWASDLPEASSEETLQRPCRVLTGFSCQTVCIVMGARRKNSCWDPGVHAVRAMPDICITASRVIDATPTSLSFAKTGLLDLTEAHVFSCFILNDLLHTMAESIYVHAKARQNCIALTASRALFQFFRLQTACHTLPLTLTPYNCVVTFVVL